MSSNVIYDITNLRCSYGKQRNSHTVLEIDSLQIQRNSLVFIVGKSGSGKSTLLESLGLMSHTIQKGTFLFNSSNGQSIDFTKVLQGDDISTSENLRKEHFSFIFQKTKFPDGYPVISSVSFSQMIQGLSSFVAQKRIDEYLNAINLNITRKTVPFELSGGMAQQAAFIRALSKEFTVLLGDEPTGNIDRPLSVKLLRLLKESLRQRNGTAIIVTHDLSLALEFADQLIVIKKDLEKNVGSITGELIFTPQNQGQWKNSHGETFTTKKLHQKIDTTITHNTTDIDLDNIPSHNNQDNSPQNNNKELYKLFTKVEQEKLSGKTHNNRFQWRSLLMALILGITFLTVGFAVGSNNYLRKKMDSPYVKLVTCLVPWEQSNNVTIDSVFAKLATPSIKNKYHIQTVTGHKIFHMHIQHATPESAYEEYKGRTVNRANPLLDEIFKEENLIAGTPFREYDIGIVVTREFLEYLGFITKDTENSSINIPFLHISIKSDLEKNDYRYVTVPVRAIVKELPETVKYITTPYFYMQRFGPGGTSTPFIEFDKRNLHLWIPSETVKFQDVLDSLQNYLSRSPLYKDLDPMVNTTHNEQSYMHGEEIAINLYPQINDMNKWDTIYNDIKNYLNRVPVNVQRIYNYPELSQVNSLDKYDHLSVYFEKLDNVGKFEKYCQQKFNLEIDIARIKQKENYNFISKLTFFLGIIMVLLAAISICVFISALVFNHLSEERENLGIHKAFGMSYRFLLSSYMYVILRFILTPLILSLSGSFIAGHVISNLITRHTLFLEQDKIYFDLINEWTILSVSVIILTVLISSFYTMKKILKSTPSDLIYSRQ